MLAPAPRIPHIPPWLLSATAATLLLSLLAYSTPAIVTPTMALPPAPITAHTVPPLPLLFTANPDPQNHLARFALGGSGGALHLGDSAVRISVNAPSDAPRQPGPMPQSAVGRHTIALSFTGANTVQPVGIDPSTTTVSSFRATPDQWRRNIPNFTAVKYPQLWNGIDLEYRVVDGQVKYAFTVAAGADPTPIELVYHGADDARITADGALELVTRHGIVRDTAPVSFQVIDGTTRDVASRFAMVRHDDGSVAVRFALGAYDPRSPLVIDPAIILSSGFIGGTGDDSVAQIVQDPYGRVIIVGTTASENHFPSIIGPDLSYNGYNDAFVGIMQENMIDFHSIGYIGGRLNDHATDVALSRNYIYVVGYTNSNESNGFPVNRGPDVTFNGSYDGFIATLDMSGELLYSGYVGTRHHEEITSVAVNGNRLYVAGMSGTGSADGFYATFTLNVPQQRSWTVVPGSGREKINNLIVHDQWIYMIGETTSNNLFIRSSWYNSTYSGGTDAFILKSSIYWPETYLGAYIGGNGEDRALDLAAYNYSLIVVGETSSDAASLKVNIGPNRVHSGLRDGFIATFYTNGSDTGSSPSIGLVGGALDDSLNAVVISTDFRVFIAGNTYSDQNSLYIYQGPSTRFSVGPEGYIAELTEDSNGIAWSGYIGGTGTDQLTDITLSRNNTLLFSGMTTFGVGLSFPVIGGPSSTYRGQNDGIVGRIQPYQTPTETATPTDTAIPTETATPTDTAIPTGTATPTSTATPTGTATPTSTATPTGTATPTSTATSTPVVIGAVVDTHDVVGPVTLDLSGVDGAITLSLEAVDGSGSLTVGQYSSPPSDLPPEVTPLSGHVDIRLDGASTSGATVRLPYREADVAAAGIDEAALRMFHRHAGQWRDITLGVDADANAIIGQTEGFSPFVLGVQAAEPCTMSIDAGDRHTRSITVRLRINVPGAAQMLIANDAGFGGTFWQPYAPSVSWELGDPGARITTLLAYVRVRDASGVPLCGGATLLDDIVYDPLPAVISEAALRADMRRDGRNAQLLTLVAEDQVGGSGVRELQLSADPGFAGTPWQLWQPAVPVALDDGASVYVRVRDGAGNVSATYQVRNGYTVGVPWLRQ